MAYDTGDLVTLGHLESVSQAIADKNYVTSAVSGISAGSTGGVEVDDNIIPLTIEKTYGGGASASELDISIPEKTVTSSSGTATLSDGGTFSTISSLTVDDYGRVSSYTKRTNSLPTLSTDINDLKDRLDAETDDFNERLTAIETSTGLGDYKVVSGVYEMTPSLSTTVSFLGSYSIGSLSDLGIPSLDSIAKVSLSTRAQNGYPTTVVMPTLCSYTAGSDTVLYVASLGYSSGGTSSTVYIYWTIWYTEE